MNHEVDVLPKDALVFVFHTSSTSRAFLAVQMMPALYFELSSKGQVHEEEMWTE